MDDKKKQDVANASANRIYEMLKDHFNQEQRLDKHLYYRIPVPSFIWTEIQRIVLETLNDAEATTAR